MIKGIKIKNFSNYWIFPYLGMVWSLKRNRWIGYPNEKGYWQVGLTNDNGQQKHFFLHRVIWQAVKGDIPEGMVINHLDEDPSNNVIWNLDMCTQKENINYGTRNERAAAKLRGRPNEKLRGKPNPKVGERLRNLLTNRKDLSKPVERCDLQGNVLERFPSTNEAQRQGYNKGNISQCCNGIFKQHKGFIWRYAI